MTKKLFLTIFASILLFGCKKMPVAPEPEPLIKSFGIILNKGKAEESIAKGVITVENNIYVKVPVGTDLTNMLVTAEVAPGLNVTPDLRATHNLSSPVEFVVSNSEKSRKYTVHVDCVPAILSYKVSVKLGSKDLIIDADIVDNKINLQLPYGVDVSSVTPEIATSNHAQIHPASGASVNITSSVTYTLTTDLGQQNVYQTNVTLSKQKVFKYIQFHASKDAVIGTLDIVNDETSTIIMMTSRDHYDKSQFASNVTVIPFSTSDMYNHFAEQIAKEPYAKYIFYTSFHTMNDIIRDWTDAAPDDNFDIQYVFQEDGTHDYIQGYNVFEDATKSNNIQRIGDQLRPVIGNRRLTAEEKALLPVVNGDADNLATRTLFSMLLNPDIMETRHCFPEAFQQATFAPRPVYTAHKIDVYAEFAKLSQEKQERFIKLFKIDRSLFEKNNGKQRLVLTGANDRPATPNARQLDMIRSVLTTYGGTYNIFFKGHPNNSTIEAMIKSEFGDQVTIIPNVLPYEALFAAGLGGDKVMGIYSSLYYGIPDDKIIKIYTTSSDLDPYITKLMIPVGAYPSDRTKYQLFSDAFPSQQP